MGRFLCVLLLVLMGCSAPPSSVYYWKTTLAWSDADARSFAEARVDRVGLRLFDWGERGEEGLLTVRSPLPSSLEVIPVVYVTTRRLEAWAADPGLNPAREAQRLLERMDRALAPAWSGTPRTWQLDADWTARNRAAWFSVAGAFAELVHHRGGRFEVTIRLHQYRDRASQGIPPADGGVLMLYGGEDLFDPALIEAYLQGPEYPLPLVPAFPAFTQVKQLNGYGRLVALHRLGGPSDLPEGDLQPLGGGRFEVLRRSALAGRPLMAHDVLVVQSAAPEDLRRVADAPPVVRIRQTAGGRVWWFDYEPRDPVPRFP